MTTKVDAEVQLPTDYSLDLGLDDINVGANANAKLGADARMDLKSNSAARLNTDAKVHVGLDDLRAKLQLSLDDIKARAKVDAGAEVTAAIKELAPLLLQFFWKEIPLVKVQSPHRYKLGFNLFGFELVALTFEGDSEVTTSNNGP